VQPTGGAGKLGWLSGIYTGISSLVATFASALNIRPLTAATDTVSVGGTLPLPTGAATASGVAAVVTALSALPQAGAPLPLPTGAAADATVAALTVAVQTLTKHLAVQNVLVSEMMDRGDTTLSGLVNDPNLLTY
jgi:hypothetical protein